MSGRVSRSDILVENGSHIGGRHESTMNDLQPLSFADFLQIIATPLFLIPPHK